MFFYHVHFCETYNSDVLFLPSNIFHNRKTFLTLATLRKQQKFETRTYFQPFPSDPIPPRLYGVIKAHKPEKCYPLPAIVSRIGSPPNVISQYLVESIQPTSNKSKNKIANSSSFVKEAKN